MARGPKCLRWRLDMPSGPVDGELLDFRMASIVLVGVNCVGRLWSIGSECSRRVIWRSDRLCGSFEMFA